MIAVNRLVRADDSTSVPTAAVATFVGGTTTEGCVTGTRNIALCFQVHAPFQLSTGRCYDI